MMHLSKTDLEASDRIRRLNIVNSISGVKPANLIGTVSEKGVKNLAVFSSVVHIGSNPPLIGFVLRPGGEVRRHTYENIVATGDYTINSLPYAFARQGHYTSAKFDAEVSEFEAVGLTPESLEGTQAPFVKESPLKYSLRFCDEISIPRNGTSLIVGEVQDVYVDENAVSDSGYIDLAGLRCAGISGLNSYYKLEKVADFPYARPHEV
ncbi:flavin reductase family protein [Pelagicoccus sp. SDUM812002]|uniref:flavin reductase family protein n=1 Tax=Pelagicoccus sp. SDUM812002 TaxID=3041266 RepID=UPI00280C5FC5|nr:flavin reductase family protein [Pelagicoccus sp. SDUM812002]MDQ8186015.1 flavin reductase family protein [Pelagicoccus sp. SDUM812002]